MPTTLSIVSMDQGRIPRAKRVSRFYSDAEWDAKLAADAVALRRMNLFQRFSRALAGPDAFYQ